ncbi:MAG: phosphopantetheine adenylyltransferase [Candidatus Bathyarchaeia archaeon]
MKNRKPILRHPLPKAPIYRRVAVGGTFDLIHSGHERLLEAAFYNGEKVVVGLSTDRLAEAIGKDHSISPFNERRIRLIDFLRERGYLERAEVIPIDDRYGTTIEDGGLEALVVSEETLGVAEQINHIRIRKGLKPLNIILVETVKAEDGKPISTSRIKRGEIDRFGKTLTSSEEAPQ